MTMLQFIIPLLWMLKCFLRITSFIAWGIVLHFVILGSSLTHLIVNGTDAEIMLNLTPVSTNLFSIGLDQSSRNLTTLSRLEVLSQSPVDRITDRFQVTCTVRQSGKVVGIKSVWCSYLYSVYVLTRYFSEMCQLSIIDMYTMNIKCFSISTICVYADWSVYI